VREIPTCLPVPRRPNRPLLGRQSYKCAQNAYSALDGCFRAVMRKVPQASIRLKIFQLFCLGLQIKGDLLKPA
jgi:hypothetical protein